MTIIMTNDYVCLGAWPEPVQVDGAAPGRCRRVRRLHLLHGHERPHEPTAKAPHEELRHLTAVVLLV